MTLRTRLACTLFGHRPHGGQATYDVEIQSFVDVSMAQYAVCTRCGNVLPSPVTAVHATDTETVDRPRDATADPTESKQNERVYENPLLGNA